MTGIDAEFEKQLLATFREEAREHVGGILDLLLRLEHAASPANPALVEQIYRNTHSLKGAARAVKKKEIESVCQHLEDVFSRMKKGAYIPDAEAFGVLYHAIRGMQALLDEGRTPVRVSEIIASLRLLTGKSNTEADGLKVPVPSQKVLPDQGPASTTRYEYPKGYRDRDAGTVRIATHKLDRLIAGSDNLLTTRLFLAHRMRELAEMRSRFSLWKRNQALVASDLHRIREGMHSPDIDRLPVEMLLPLQRLVESVGYDREFIADLERDLALHIRATDRDGAALKASTTGITDLIHEAVLMPVSSVLSAFPGLVRDYSENTGKKVSFEVTGSEIEVDRRILDTLKDPLIHLVYNSIDHGIEYPDIREAAAKSVVGHVRIRVTTPGGGRVKIEISDDGKGLDGSRIRSSALKAGLISLEENARISDQDAIWLIFRSGFSTNPVVTEISGRGLGLAIVEDTVTRLGGRVMVASRVGRGTRFTLDVPVRLVTFRGVVVRCGNQTYVLPMQQVQQVIRVSPDTLTRQDGRAAIRRESGVAGIFHLPDLLGESRNVTPKKTGELLSLVIIAYGAGQVACAVDEILRVQEIVVHPLGSQLRRVRRISGAALLGDGTLALVLDPPELIQEALRSTGLGVLEEPGAQKPFTILVVEDSVTSRAYLQALLEREGYQVITAPDGRMGLAMVREKEPDLVISDVDMPIMNGFLLAEKIRKDLRFITLPVILVTSLDSAKDRQHGIAVGVDAYLVKSSFKNGVLIETIRNLLQRGRRTNQDL